MELTVLPSMRSSARMKLVQLAVLSIYKAEECGMDLLLLSMKLISKADEYGMGSVAIYEAAPVYL